MLAPGKSTWGRFSSASIPIVLVLLTVVACLVRANGMPAVQGTMGRDEARLALAARGILDHGLPIMGDGFLYTRGLLPAYLNALTFAVLGSSDQAARTSDLVFSTLLVVAVYWLGRLAGGPRPALVAALIVTFSPPLVLQAREAWLYSTFLLWLTLAVGWLVRDAPGDRLRAGLAAVAALLSHELAVLFVPVALVIDLGRAWRSRRRADVTAGGLAHAAGRTWPRSGRMVLVFWALLLAGVAIVGALSMLLRSQTLGGPTVEVQEYLRPGFDLRGLTLSFAILGRWHPWLLPVAVLGLPLSRSSWRAFVAGRGLMPCLLMAVVVICFNSFGLVRRGESRYMLAAVPFLAIAAAVALDRLGPPLISALTGWRLRGQMRQLVRLVLLTLLVAANFDPVRLVQDANARAVPDTWVQAVADRQPADLIVSFAPTLTSHYLGRTDFWLRTEGYAKYVWNAPPPLRDVHTSAVVLRNQGELDRLLLVPHQGRTVWVVLASDPSTETLRVLRAMEEQLIALAVETRRPSDGRVVLKLEL
jgi:4-amino-4-deoxy-L-arabinose transferase-like glycosyltransferase